MALITMSISLTLLITLIMIPKSTSNPNFLYYSCPNTINSAPNTKFQNNLDDLFRSLSSNAAASSTGFYTASAGNTTNDTVYGLFLCRGDQSASACSDCVSTASLDLALKYCPNTQVAVIWYDECMVRYSNQSILGVMDSIPAFAFSNVVNGTLSQLTENLTETAYNLAEVAANNTSGKKFATEEVDFPSSFLSFYAFEECTPDLTASDCERCLRMAIAMVPVRLGWRVLMPSCNVRYDYYPFFNGAVTSRSPVPSTPTAASSNSTKKRKQLLRISLFVAIPTSTTISILLFFGFWICMHKRKAMETFCDGEIDEIRTVESLQFDFSTIRTATRNFSTDNKLGQGGFGEVYKGKLENGQEVAVKRLSINSQQGVAEFKTEVILVAKLQHKNLVKLLGFCLTPKEKILVYEFLPNLSLDRFLFDRTRNTSLDWQTRFGIIVGIARGLLYLHEDSRLKIIHRDLKSSNILLDEAMNAKISDFGMAKLFDLDETQGDTKRIVGTYGYMAPEYAITGHYSVKSDVYSFGVIVLEIISGQRSRLFSRVQLQEALLHRAWRLWNEGKALDLLDETLSNNFPKEEAIKCIHIGLLCIQEDAVERPRMTSVVAALNGQSISLPIPKAPHFFGCTQIEDHPISEQHNYRYTGTQTITDLYPRQ